MEDLKNELKKCLNNYRNVDDQLRQLNKLVYDLREKRKMVEIEIPQIPHSIAICNQSLKA